MRRLILAIGLAFFPFVAQPAAAAGPDSNLAANVNGGGCYPQPLTGDFFSMLNLINPEWAPVTSGTTVDSVPVLLRGTVNDVHGQVGGDFPSTHISSDMVAELTMDAADVDRAATGNGGNNLALEWEARAIPTFAWPGEGDHVTALGRWIFDCGHPGAVPGNCSTTVAQQCITDFDCATSNCDSCVSGETCVGVQYNYSSEVHAPHAIVSTRQGRGFQFSKRKPPIAVTKVDIYVSSFSGGAGDRCILTHSANYIDLLSVECYPLSDPVAQINSQDLVFDIPLPPPPVAGGGIKKRVIRHPKPVGERRARLRLMKFLDDPQPHLTATVRLTANSQPTFFASTILVGWALDTTALTHVRLTLQSIKINNATRPANPVSPKTCSTANTPCSTSADCPMGELCLGAGTVKGWYMDTAVNGEWQRLNDLEDVDSGDEITQNLVFDQYLTAGDEVHFVSKGKSQECIDSMYGKSLHQDLSEQGLSKGSNCLFSTARETGIFDVAYAGPDFGAGLSGSTDYETQSVGGEGGHCSVTTSTLCVGPADCPMGQTCVVTGGSYSLKYRIERLP